MASRKPINVDDLLKDLGASLNEFMDDSEAEPSPLAAPAPIKSLIHDALNSAAPDEDSDDPYDLLDSYGDEERTATLARSAPEVAPVPVVIPVVQPQQPQQQQPQSPVIMSRQQSVGALNPPAGVRSAQFAIPGTAAFTFNQPPSQMQEMPPQASRQPSQPSQQSFPMPGLSARMNSNTQLEQDPPQRIPTPLRTPVNMVRMNSNNGRGISPNPVGPNSDATSPTHGIRRGSNAQYTQQQQQQQPDSIPSPRANHSLDYQRRGSTATTVTSASNDEAQEEVRRLRQQLEMAKLELIDQMQVNKRLLTQQQSEVDVVPVSVVANAKRGEFQGVDKPMTPSTKDKGDSASISSAKSARSTKSSGGWMFGRSKSQSRSAASEGKAPETSSSGGDKKKIPAALPNMPMMMASPHMMGRF
ncbi:hypothetical protein BDR26DRAFT_868243 [Obelidium mucronatum]|nr:hypothetical protein BDR26DRAFT_868243 [Obelidium mucronatum]